MITVYSEKHRLHDAKTELYGGTLVPPYERPSRAEIVLHWVQSEQLGEVITPKEFGLDPVLTLHDAGSWSSCAWRGTSGPRRNTKARASPPAGLRVG